MGMRIGCRFHQALVAALIVSSIAVVVAPAGCGGSGGGAADGGSDSGVLTVFAASSLTDAFGELEERFEEQNPGVGVRQSFESSSTLLTQIQQGAPADVFAPAAREEMRTAAQDGLMVGEPEVFVKNREVIMVPQENPANIQTMRDLAKTRIKIVLTEDGVPAVE